MPSVRYVYDRPLPHARHLRIDIVGDDGSVVACSVASFEPGRGWVTQDSSIGVGEKSDAA
jgi:hypothetical protein